MPYDAGQSQWMRWNKFLPATADFRGERPLGSLLATRIVGSTCIKHTCVLRLFSLQPASFLRLPSVWVSSWSPDMESQAYYQENFPE
jgi:hypothetical protein